MSNRRNFLKTTSIASVAVALNAFRGKSEEKEIVATSGNVKKPVVLSTWNFG